MYLGIVETESGSPRLSRDLIWDCNLGIRLLDSSVGAFAITSLGALFAVASLLYWECVSRCFVPALPVWELFAVGVVVVPALTSPSLKIDAPPKTNIVRLHDARYRHCSCVTRNRIWYGNSGM